MKTVTVPLHMFPNLRIRVMVFSKPDEYIYWRKKNWEDIRESYCTASCLGYQRTRTNYDVDIVMLKSADKCPKATLVHEIVHAAQFISENYKIKDVEFDAYLVGYIFQTCLKKKLV